MAADHEAITQIRDLFQENQARERALACIHTSEMLMSQYDSEVTKLLEEKLTTENGSLQEEFTSLTNFRRGVRADMDSFERMAENYQPQSLQSIIDDFNKIDAEARSILSSLRILEKKNQLFLRLIDVFESRLLTLEQALAYGSKQLAWNDCAALNLGSQIEAARRNIQSLLTVGHAMRLHILYPKEHLFTEMGLIRDRVQHLYEAKVTSTFDHRVGLILATLRAQKMIEALLDKKIIWQNDIVLNGWDDGHYSKYLQYGPALASVRGKIDQGVGLLNALHSLSHHLEISEYENDIKNTLQTLTDQKTKLEEASYAGVIARQFFLNKKRLERIPRDREFCRKKLINHLSLESKSQSPEFFAEIDRVYFDSMEACRL
jgi:hypothetical protein